jgi:hypothetical protein
MSTKEQTQKENTGKKEDNNKAVWNLRTLPREIVKWI